MVKKGYKSITFPDRVANVILDNPKSLTQLMEERLKETESLHKLVSNVKKTPVSVRVYV